MRVDNLKQSELAALTRRVRALETQAPGGHSAVSKGTTRFIGNESVKVLGSGLVSGWWIITGTLKVVGAFLLEGATTMTGNLVSSGTALFTGAFTTRGTTRLEGDTTQQGPFHIEGATDLTGDLSVVGAGKIAVGNMRIGEGTHGDGKGVSFTNGGALSASGSGVEVYAATNGILSVTPTRSQLSSGGSAIRLDSAGVNLAGLDTKSGVTANVYIDGNGQLWRVT